jgi:predicted RNA-binding protein YlqC (UPF0109 family)
VSTTIDQQFVEFIVKSLVSSPDKVSIERSIDEKGVLLELTVDSEDLGRVIGKRGASAQALRTLLRALGTKNDARYNLKIVDPEGGERPRRDDRRDEDNRRDDSDSKANESSSSNDKPANEEAEQKPVDEAKPEIEAPVEEKPALQEEKVEEPEEDGRSSFERTRRELQDLDDLDI